MSVADSRITDNLVRHTSNRHASVGTDSYRADLFRIPHVTAHRCTSAFRPRQVQWSKNQRAAESLVENLTEGSEQFIDRTGLSDSRGLLVLFELLSSSCRQIVHACRRSGRAFFTHSHTRASLIAFKLANSASIN